MLNAEFDNYLNALWRKSRLSERQRDDLRRELQGHFDDALEYELGQGTEPREAVRRALADLGDAGDFAAALDQPYFLRRILMRSLLSAACVVIVATGFNFLNSSTTRPIGRANMIALAEAGDSAPVQAAPSLINLDQRIGNIDLKSSSLSDALDYLSDTLKCNLHVRWSQLEALGVARDQQVSLRLKDVTARQFLDLMLSEIADGNVSYRIDGNILLISGRDERPQDMATRVYDVTDLVGSHASAAGAAGKPAPEPKDFQLAIDSDPIVRHFRFQGQELDKQFKELAASPGREAEGARNRSQRDQYEQQEASRISDLQADFAARLQAAAEPLSPDDSAAVKLIQILEGAIDPECWSNNGGKGFADIFRGALVVRQSADMHKRVELLLDELRKVAQVRHSAATAAVAK